jgi:zinc D-Ala-D-Ala carboxypeptidase
VKISKNFSLGECLKSDTAQRLGLKNEITQEGLVALTALVTHCMQPLREHFGRSIRCNSAWRTPLVSEAVGSSSRSQHCRGEAMDWEIVGIDNKELAQQVPKILSEWDQMILELYDESEKNPEIRMETGWIHLSYNRMGENRKQILRAFRKGKKIVYEPWDLS